MKKFLVLCVSAAMLLSMAAASLAAATVTGDFRYNMIEDDSKDDKSFGETDLRFKVSGDVSETVKAWANFQVKETNNSGFGKIGVDEFKVVAKYAWCTADMGFYEYNFTPNRVELSTAGLRVTPKNDATFELDIPLTEALQVDAVVLPYSTKSTGSGSYAVALNYKAEKWGVKVAYWDLKANDYDYTCIDAFYKINDNMKVFANAADYSYNDGVRTAKLSDNVIIYEEGIDPVIGFAWSNIADTQINASIEYALNSRYDQAEKSDFNEFIIKAAYKLANGIGLEAFHYVIGDGKNKEVLRLRYQF